MTDEFDSLSSIDLRQKLLEYGYDLPTSVEKGFMLKKLRSVQAKNSVRATPPPAPQSAATLTPSSVSRGRNARQSLAVDMISPAPAQSQLLRNRRMTEGGLRIPETHERHEEEQAIRNQTSARSSVTPSGSSSWPRTWEPPENDYENNGYEAETELSFDFGSPSRQNGHQEPTEEEEESFEDEENHSPSPRFENYLRYFKSNSKSDPFISPRSQYTSPMGSPSSTTAAAGSPFKSTNFSFAEDSAEDSDFDLPPVANQRRSLASRIYSPSPPVVAPAVAAGRQAGFKTFFSRGQRNGYGYPSDRAAPQDTAHLVPKLLLFAFITAAVAVLGSYFYMSTVTEQWDNAPNEPRKSEGLFEDMTTNFQASSSKSKPKPVVTDLIYPICQSPGYPSEPCVPESLIRDSHTMFTALRNELTLRSRNKGCDEGQDKISLSNAKTLLYNLVALDRHIVDLAFDGMLMLVTENPTTGMKIEDSELLSGVTIQDVPSLNLDSATITIEGASSLNIVCLLWGGLLSFIYYIGYLGMMTSAGYLTYRFIKFRQGLKAKQEEEVFTMVDTVVKILEQHYYDSKNTGQDEFVGINFIRDYLIDARDRKSKEGLWNKVVAQISNTESRVREEIQHISGEEFRVWRWLPSASPLNRRMSSAPTAGNSTSTSPGLYPNLGSVRMDLDSSVGYSPSSVLSNSQWQGQAFETYDGSPNSMTNPPTTCLKIRQMYDSAKNAGENQIEQAILAKCQNAKILHIGIDQSSREGCVYIRCQTKLDARNAYSALHGWWYEGHLLSVKFLREDRYFTRFPNAKYLQHPLTIN